MMTYVVQPDGPAWKIVQGTAVYGGYRSRASASTAAVTVATKVGLTGKAATVLVQDSDGTLTSIFSSDPEPPTLDSMLEAAERATPS